MSEPLYARAKEIFLAAIARPPDERAGVLSHECRQDSALRDEVERLLAHHHQDETLVPALQPASPGSGMPAQDELTAGTVVAERYRIVARLGSGGMGTVYRAEDLVLQQNVALKFLSGPLANHPVWIARLRNEVRLARTVTHPNVCRVHDIVESEGRWFISMEYIDGEDLASLLRRIGRPSTDKALDITRQVCFGLSAAHSAGVLHRDLKPANIMVDGQGQVRLTDFGVAALPGQIDAHDIRTGTPAYMSPEQITGRDVSIQSDLYVLGLVLYELFSGKPAFRAKSLAEYIELQENAQPEELSELVDGIPDGVVRAVESCLRKDPWERPASALMVAASLPGADVLAAALAADQTPPPELVAAASTHGRTFSRSRAVLLTAVFFAAFIILKIGLPSRWDVLGTISPEALAERSRRVLEDAGYARGSAYEDFGYIDGEVQRPTWTELPPTASAPRPLSLGAIDPCAQWPVFWYRQSPLPLAASNVESVMFGSGHAMPEDPPHGRPGERIVMLDLSGRLLRFDAAPHDHDAAPTNVATTEEAAFESLLRAADFVPQETKVDNIPSDHAYADGRTYVWRQSLRGDESEYPIVASGESFDHKPIRFAVGQPTSEQSAPATAAGANALERWNRVDSACSPAATRKSILRLSTRILFLIVMAVSLPWAWRGYWTNRIDRNGGVRMALVVFVGQMAVVLLRIYASPTLYDGVLRLLLGAVRAAGFAALSAAFYVAVDLYARRYWPHMLVTWNRALLCKFADRDVRSHLALGACLGCFWALIANTERILVAALGLPEGSPLRGESIAEKLYGGRALFAGYLDGATQAVLYGLLFLLLLVLARSVVRRPLLAAVIVGLLLVPMIVPRGANIFTSLIFLGLGGVAVCIWAMTRFGLLTIVTGLFVVYILNTTPMTVQLNSWYVGFSAFSLAIVAGLAAYGLSAKPLPTGRSE